MIPTYATAIVSLKFSRMSINARPLLADRRGHAADQLAPAFRRASLDRYGYPVDCQCVVCGNDFVDAVWFPAGVGLGAGNFVTQPGDCFSPDVVVGRTANHCAAMVGFVSDCNDLQ